MATRYTEILSPPIPNPESVKKAVANIRTYSERANEYSKINDEFKKRTGVDIFDVSDARGLVSKRMVTEGKERSAKGKQGAVPVYGDPLNQNTCAAGVCTVAANAGVNFNNMRGNLQTGLATDEKGRKIPQYNPLISSQLDKTGYYELAANEKPQPGDLVQYFEPTGDAGALNPYHLEFITDDKGGGRYGTFNNYGLFNEGRGESEVADVRGTNMSERGRASTINRFYRLTPEASAKAAGDANIKDIDISNKFKQELAGIRQSGMEGESENVFGILWHGVKNNTPKEKVLKNALALAKNKEYVKAVADELYK
jgi:hypothetical protein